jgi:hypothetical protein
MIATPICLRPPPPKGGAQPVVPATKGQRLVLQMDRWPHSIRQAPPAAGGGAMRNPCSASGTGEQSSGKSAIST